MFLVSVQNEPNDDPHDDEDDDDSCDWPDALTGRIIELWSEQNLLWDNSHKYYANRDKRLRAHHHIAKEAKISGKINISNKMLPHLE